VEHYAILHVNHTVSLADRKLRSSDDLKQELLTAKGAKKNRKGHKEGASCGSPERAKQDF
jgi:hypothetical protein